MTHQHSLYGDVKSSFRFNVDKFQLPKFQRNLPELGLTLLSPAADRIFKDQTLGHFI